ncbi:hypothetical protein LCGC14_3161000 [marine sediment metagenome]|uniref:Uncharacterized protein n=1 Tax=marine sediment metagenome TaxID=412755 RepID=A0A0F8VR99_9ZZZZ
MINTILQLVFFIGFIWVIIDLTKSMCRDTKARKKLTQIEQLVKQASETDDEKVKEETKEKIFQILKAKL